MTETINLKVHPNEVNKVMALFAKFGWKVLANQRNQEYGEEKDIHGEIKSYMYTFNMITFQRDSKTSIYDDYLYKMITEYNSYSEEKEPIKPSEKDIIPFKPFYDWRIRNIIGAIIFLICFILNKPYDSSAAIFYDCLIIPGFIYNVTRLIVEFVKYKKELIKYNREINRYMKNSEEYMKPYFEKFNESKNIYEEHQKKMVMLEKDIEKTSKQYYGNNFNKYDYRDYMTYINRARFYS